MLHLDNALQRNINGPNNIESLITVVCGLGGIGKTQLVREYVNQNKSKYDDNVIWITADKEETIIETFKILANEKLYIRTIGENGADKNIISIVQDVYDYFSGKRFLFVYDNVESMENIRKFLLFGPCNPNTRPYILITSRVQQWHSGIEVIRLDEWEVNEAIEFVSTMLSHTHPNENQDDLKLLVEDLQCFPLALRQATTYIINKLDTISDYRVKYEKQKKELLNSKLFQDHVSKYTETTFTTWNITIRTIEQDNEFGSLAIKILNTMAYFAPDNIHRAPLIDLAKESKESTSRALGKYFIRLVVSEIFNVPNVSQAQVNEKKKIVDVEEYLKSAVSLLVKYSMIGSQERQSILRIHRAVQDVIKVTLKNKGQEKKVLRDTLILIDNLMVRVAHTSHAVSVYQHALDYSELVRDFSALPNKILMNLIIHLRKEEAILFGNQVLEKIEKCLGPNDLTLDNVKFNVRYAKMYATGLFLNNNETGYQMYEELYKMRAKEIGEDTFDTMAVKSEIGKMFLLMGKTEDALAMLENVYGQYELTLGYQHEETILSEEIIATSYLRVGLYTKALERFSEVYEKKRSIFGEKHRKTLFTLNMIGKVLFFQEKYTEALPIFDKIYKNRSELGEDHDTVLKAMQNMARTYGKQGIYDESIKIYKNIHEIKIKKWGQHHPETLSALNDFGAMLSEQWNFIDALPIFKEIYLSKAKLGTENEIILAAMRNMGHIYTQQGNYEESEQIYREVHSKRIEILGENHPDTVSAFSDIGEILLDQQKYTDALLIFDQIYKNRMQLGEGSEIILTSMNNIAFIYAMLRNYDESLNMRKKVHTIRIKINGEKDPMTLRVLDLIGTTLFDQGNYTEALRIFQEIYANKSELGDEHTIIKFALKNLAYTYAKLGDYELSLQFFKEIHDKSNKILGENHPETVSAFSDIGRFYSDHNNYTDALPIFYKIYEKRMILGENNVYH